MSQPYYASERAFRLYEPIIGQAIASLPNPISFVSKGETRHAATDAARCRDAISAWLISRWPSPLAKTAAIVATLRVFADTSLDKVFISDIIGIRRVKSALEFARVHGIAPDLTYVKHWLLTERKIDTGAIKSPPADLPKLPVNPALIPRPLLFPSRFTHDDFAKAVDPCLIDSDEITPPDSTLRDTINGIESGALTGQHIFPIEQLPEIDLLLAGKLNVGKVVKDGQVILF